jgi:hypothetical protein
MSVSVDMAPQTMAPMAPTALDAQGNPVNAPLSVEKPGLVASFRTTEGRQADFNLPVKSAVGLTPGETYDVTFDKVTDKS